MESETEKFSKTGSQIFAEMSGCEIEKSHCIASAFIFLLSFTLSPIPHSYDKPSFGREGLLLFKMADKGICDASIR